MNMNELQNALDRAKIGLMQCRNSAFFTTIAFSLKHIWDDTQPTAYVDGVHMGWNPDFFLKLTSDERIGVMVHEACHVAYDHIGRLNAGMVRCPDIFNQAADHVINLMLLAKGFKLPSFRLADQRFVDMSTEQVYDILQAEAAQGKPMPQLPMADLRTGKPGDPDNQTGMDADQLAKHVKGMILQAALASKMAGDAPGSIPGDIELLLEEILNPVLPWTTILRRYMTEFNKNDYSWRKPNRRFFPNHYLPSLYSNSLQDLTFYVDISCSVMDYQFQMFVNEIAGVLKHLKPKFVTIVQFDTRIQHIDKVSNLQELKAIQFTGRGGTSIHEILDHMEANKNSLSLVFTDGGFHFPRTEFKQRIIWLINDNPKWVPVFGDAIHFSTKEYKK